jgi:hypothetical protein
MNDYVEFDSTGVPDGGLLVAIYVDFSLRTSRLEEWERGLGFVVEGCRGPSNLNDCYHHNSIIQCVQLRQAVN